MFIEYSVQTKWDALEFGWWSQAQIFTTPLQHQNILCAYGFSDTISARQWIVKDYALQKDSTFFKFCKDNQAPDTKLRNIHKN